MIDAREYAHPNEARRAHDDGYRAGFLAGHADAIDELTHLSRRGISLAAALVRVRRFHWKHVRPWGEGPELDGERRPEFCRTDRHGDHIAGDDDDEA